MDFELYIVETGGKMCTVAAIKGILVEEIKNHSKLMEAYFKEDISRVMITKFLIVNSFKFRKGLFINYLDQMHQIEVVLELNKSFILLCTKYTTTKFFKFANCFQIEKSTETVFIEFDMLLCKRSFEAKILHDQTQIIADNLDMVPIYEKYIL